MKKRLMYQLAGGGTLALAFALVSAGGASASDGHENYGKDCDHGRTEQRDWNAEKSNWYQQHGWRWDAKQHRMVSYKHDDNCDPQMKYAMSYKHDNKHEWSKGHDCD